MNVWLITVGEPLPIDGPDERLLRTGILANYLTDRGHHSIWWTSTFDHYRKRHRYDGDKHIRITESFKITLLRSTGYRKNVSLFRFMEHLGIARKFSILASWETAPDIILCSLPTIELSNAAVRFGKKNKIPVILDMRDLWPDIILELVPTWAKKFSRFLLTPMFRGMKYACTHATAITGITNDFVKWGIEYTGRERTSYDRVFPFGYSEKRPVDSLIDGAERYWKSLGVTKDSNKFIICLFASNSRVLELNCVLHAIRELCSINQQIQFVLCGNYQLDNALLKNCNNVILPGWVDAAKIWVLMRISSVGLLPYKSRVDFKKSLPNKSIEYLSAKLPVVFSLEGSLEKLLIENNCGVIYENNNPGDMIQKLLYLYSHPEQLRKMSENAYNLYKRKFVAEHVYTDMVYYLEEIVASFKAEN